MEDGNQGSPTGTLSVVVETKAVDAIEVDRLITNKSESQEHKTHDVEWSGNKMAGEIQFH